MKKDNPYGIELVSGIELSEHEVYFSKSWVKGQDYHSSIFIADASGLRKVTQHGHETMPVVKDGALFYMSREQGLDTVMKLMETSEPNIICRFRKITSFVPYRNGVLAVVSENFKSTTPFIIKRLRYKHDSTGMLRKRRSLYYASSDGIRKITASSYDISDIKTNGERIVVSASRTGDDLGLADLYEVNFITGDLTKITSGQGLIDAFDMSSKGEVAFVGHRSGPRDWPTRKVYLPESGKEFDIDSTAGCFTSTDLFDDSGSAIRWDSSGLYLMGQKGGVTSVFSIRDTQIERLTPEDRSVRHFDVLGGKISYSYSTASLSSVLVSEFGEVRMKQAYEGLEAIHLNSGDVEGWGIVSGQENPTLLVIHGGPHSAFGPLYNIEIQYFARNGYNVIYCNPRGSMGYGEDFARGSVGSWGIGDRDDIMNFLMEAKKRFGLTGKVGVKGVSYGGYMVNWLITQTQEFSAAVSEKGISNLLSSCGTSDIGYWFDAPEEIGTTDPWSLESIDLFMKKSPISFVRNVRTPTLIIHGEEDHRCPIEQSEQLFTALKFYGVDTVFVRVPGESHELDNRENPVHRADLFEVKRDWLNKYLKGIETSKTSSAAVKL